MVLEHPGCGLLVHQLERGIPIACQDVMVRGPFEGIDRLILERGGTVRLQDVTVTPRVGGATMTVLLTLPRRQAFEENAERAYESVWHALSGQANAYRELGRVLVSLKRSSRKMTVDCPARFVQGTEGQVRFEGLKKSCRVRQAGP